MVQPSSTRLGFITKIVSSDNCKVSCVQNLQVITRNFACEQGTQAHSFRSNVTFLGFLGQVLGTVAFMEARVGARFIFSLSCYREVSRYFLGGVGCSVELHLKSKVKS